MDEKEKERKFEEIIQQYSTVLHATARRELLSMVRLMIGAERKKLYKRHWPLPGRNEMRCWRRKIYLAGW